MLCNERNRPIYDALHPAVAQTWADYDTFVASQLGHPIATRPVYEQVAVQVAGVDRPASGRLPSVQFDGTAYPAYPSHPQSCRDRDVAWATEVANVIDDVRVAYARDAVLREEDMAGFRGQRAG